MDVPVNVNQFLPFSHISSGSTLRLHLFSCRTGRVSVPFLEQRTYTPPWSRLSVLDLPWPLKKAACAERVAERLSRQCGQMCHLTARCTPTTPPPPTLTLIDASTHTHTVIDPLVPSPLTTDRIIQPSGGLNLVFMSASQVLSGQTEKSYLLFDTGK